MSSQNLYNRRVKARMDYNEFKSLFLVILFLFLLVKSLVTEGQSMKGLSASFGTRSFAISSDIPEINAMKVVQEGGSAGLVWGGEVLLARLNAAGFFYSAARVPRTVNLFETELLLNYYALRQLGSLGNSRFQPYLVAGVSQDFIKFYGSYLNQEKGKPTNNSLSEEPLLGKVRQTTASFGLGMDWCLINDGSFIRLFAETRYGTPLGYQADQSFRNTSIANGASIRMGVHFGMYK